METTHKAPYLRPETDVVAIKVCSNVMSPTPGGNEQPGDIDI